MFKIIASTMMDVVCVFKFLSFDIVPNFELRISNFNLLNIHIGSMIPYNVCMIR